MSHLTSLRRTVLALAALAALALGRPAAAGPTVPHKESCDGKVAFPAAGSLTFAGQGTATHMGRYTISGGNQLTPDGKVTDGTFTSVAADGSTITGVYAGKYTPLPGNKVRFDVTVCWQTGTGRLAGVTGTGTVVAILNLNTNTYHYDTLGTWTFP
jgi:hypothetical protein